MDSLTQDRCRSGTATFDAPGAPASPSASGANGWQEATATVVSLGSDGSVRLADECRRSTDHRDHLAWLVQTIETEIIPRLMLAHQGGRAHPAAANSALRVPGEDQVDELTQRVLGADALAGAVYVDALRADGMPLDAIYLLLLAPTARRLGTMWESDLCDFTQVTVGLWRLQQVVYELGPLFQSGGDARADETPRALLIAAPGSQHTMGILIVSEFFRRAGWDVAGDPCANAGDLADRVGAEWFDIAGLSIGTEVHLGGVGLAIGALRRASLNPDIGVLVGGPILAQFPDLAARVGADDCAGDAPQAVARAEAFLKSRARHC